MLTCRDVTEMTTDYLEGSLSAPQRIGMRWHLAICSFCRRHLKQVRATVALLRRMPPIALSRIDEDELIAEITQQPPAPPAAPPD